MYAYVDDLQVLKESADLLGAGLPGQATHADIRRGRNAVASVATAAAVTAGRSTTRRGVHFVGLVLTGGGKDNLVL